VGQYRSGRRRRQRGLPYAGLWLQLCRLEIKRRCARHGDADAAAAAGDNTAGEDTAGALRDAAASAAAVAAAAAAGTEMNPIYASLSIYVYIL